MSEYELRAAPKRSGCIWFCLKSVMIVVVGFICLQLLIAVVVVMLGLFGDGIDSQFQEIQKSLNEQSGASLIVELPDWA